MQIRPIDANALEQFAYCTEPATWDNPYGGDYVVKMEDIEKLPTLDWTPIKHGQWIEYQYRSHCNNEVRDRYRCSICHHIEKFPTQYCADCGAKMDLEEEV